MRSYDSPGVITPHPISSHGVDVTCSHKSGNYLALPFSTSEIPRIFYLLVSSHFYMHVQ